MSKRDPLALGVVLACGHRTRQGRGGNDRSLHGMQAVTLLNLNDGGGVEMTSVFWLITILTTTCLIFGATGWWIDRYLDRKRRNCRDAGCDAWRA